MSKAQRAWSAGRSWSQKTRQLPETLRQNERRENLVSLFLLPSNFQLVVPLAKPTPTELTQGSGKCSCKMSPSAEEEQATMDLSQQDTGSCCLESCHWFTLPSPIGGFRRRGYHSPNRWNPGSQPGHDLYFTEWGWAIFMWSKDLILVYTDWSGQMGME